MAQVLVNGRVLTPHGLAAATVLVEGDRIAEVRPPVAGEPGIDLQGGYLLPGFIDTQVNGGGGALFNDAPSVEAIATIGAAHRAFGTTGFLPTLISDDLSAVASANRGRRRGDRRRRAGGAGHPHRGSRS
jgi:N-acetylglucosamine-6-phosphate deacetylase